MKLTTSLLAATAFAAMTSVSAYAQDGIEVVTVTAAKRSQDVQDVPISMNVIGATQLNKFNAASLSDLMKSVPSLVISKSPTNVGLFMRGFGTGPANPSTDMAVSVYQDGIWQEKSRNLMIDFFDVQRIEVLRGAQGALVGKNTEVGAISIISNDPTDEFEGSVTVNYNFDHKGTDTYGYVSGPITDDLSARLAIKVVDQSGWIKNLAGGANEPDLSKYQGRLSLKFQPQEGITNVLKVEYSAWNQLGNIQMYQNPALDVSTALKATCCTKTDSGPLGRHTFDKQHGWRMSNKLDVDLGDGYTLQSISGFTAYNSDSLGAGSAVNPSNFATDFIEKYEGASTELRILSPVDEGNAIDWIVGAYTDYSRYGIDNAIDYTAAAVFISGGGNGGSTIFFRENTFSYSVYAAGTWHITDDLRLLANARYTRSDKSATYNRIQRYGNHVVVAGSATPGGPALDLGPTFIGLIRTNSGNIGSNFFDPSVTAQYDVNDDIMVYASWSKGSKGAAFDAVSRSAAVGFFVFKPESSTNYEVGVKSNWFDNMVTLNATAFLMQVKNMQVSGFDPVLNTLITKNTGQAESKGVEVELNVRPFEGLSINNSVNYIDARYTDYPGAGCLDPYFPAFKTGASPYYFNTPGQATCINSPLNNQAGVPLQFVPMWSGNTVIDYTVPVMDELKIDLTGSMEWRGPMWLNPGLNPVYGKHPGITKFNLRAALGADDDSWSIAVVGKNLTNTLSTQGAATLWGSGVTGLSLDGGVKPAEVEAFLDEPRNISIQASLKF